MASYRQRGKTWTCYYYITDPITGQRQQKSKGGFRTRKDAEAWFIRTESDRLGGFHGTPESLTVSGYMETWLASRPYGKPSAGTLRNYRDLNRLYIVPYIGGVRLARLDSLTLQRWHNQLRAKPIRASTVRNVHTLLSSALSTAVDNGMLHRNPCRLAPPPKPERPERTRLDADQIRAFLAASDGHKLGLLYRTAIFTLMRPGELVALKWSDINWQRQTIHVHRTRRRNEDRAFFLGDGAKTDAGNRTVVIHDELLQRLRRHRTKQMEHRLQYEELWHDNDLVFCRDDGTMVRNTTMTTALSAICERAGVPRVTPHQLRHSGATLMVEMNENLKVISERLGHASIAMTADVYLGVSENLQRQVSDRMAAVLSSAS